MSNFNSISVKDSDRWFKLDFISIIIALFIPFLLWGLRKGGISPEMWIVKDKEARHGDPLQYPHMAKNLIPTENCND